MSFNILSNGKEAESKVELLPIHQNCKTLPLQVNNARLFYYNFVSLQRTPSKLAF